MCPRSFVFVAFFFYGFKSKLTHHCFFPGLNNEEYQAVIGNDTTRYIIDDLEPACNYTFYIVAYMPMGASRMSDHVFQHTLEDGEPPCEIRETFAS